MVIRKPKKVLDYCGAFRTGSTELPSEYVLDRKLWPDVRNQENVNSCVGYATSGILQILNEIETGKRIRFSPGYIYGRLREDEDTYEGMVIDEMLEHLIKQGDCFETDFPDNKEMPEIRELVLSHPELDAKAEPYKIKAYEVYAQGNREKRYNAVKAALYQFKVPILADMDFNGCGHAVCIIGWNDNTQRFMVVNSYGENWGNKGVGNVNYTKLNRGYLLVDEKNSNEIMPFRDVDENEWYYKAIQHAYNAGFMNGTSADTFEPERALTRAEFAQALVNFAKKLEDTKEG